MKHQRTLSLIACTAFVTLGYATPRQLSQEELVLKSDAIAIVAVSYREIAKTYGEIRDDESDTDYPTGIVLYQSVVIQVIDGSIPTEPIIFQFSELGDQNLLDPGNYLVFLKQDGYLFRIVDTFVVSKNSVYWFTKRFEAGDLGPEMSNVPIDTVVNQIKQLIHKYNES